MPSHDDVPWGEDEKPTDLATPSGDHEWGDLDFGEALIHLRAARRVQRRGWNGPGQFLELQVPDEHSKMSLPCVFITTVQGDRVPWLASQTDLLAYDWRVV